MEVEKNVLDEFSETVVELILELERIKKLEGVNLGLVKNLIATKLLAFILENNLQQVKKPS